MENSLMFSSQTDQWATPQDFFEKVNAVFNFDLDVCAGNGNHKCDKFFTQEDDGLKQTWGGGMLDEPALWT